MESSHLRLREGLCRSFAGSSLLSVVFMKSDNIVSDAVSGIKKRCGHYFKRMTRRCMCIIESMKCRVCVTVLFRCSTVPSLLACWIMGYHGFSGIPDSSVRRFSSQLLPLSLWIKVKLSALRLISSSPTTNPRIGSLTAQGWWQAKSMRRLWLLCWAKIA